MPLRGLICQQVVGFTVVDTVDQAIKLANTTGYSLTASIWTERIDGLKLAERLRAGMLSILMK